MIIYNVTVNIDNDVRDEWVKWMKEEHIPEVMNTGLFTEYRMCRVMVEEESGTTYSVQYSCRNMETLEKYQRDYAPALQKKHTSRYEGKFVAFRTLLELI
jgi:hypothetical protein